MPRTDRGRLRAIRFGLVAAASAGHLSRNRRTRRRDQAACGYEENCETLAGDPYNTGWMIKVALTDESSLKNLMDATAYEKQCAAEG